MFFPPDTESSRLSRHITAMSMRVGRDPVAVPAFSGMGDGLGGVHRVERPVVDDEKFSRDEAHLGLDGVVQPGPS
jgi:hypothetical protein